MPLDATDVAYYTGWSLIGFHYADVFGSGVALVLASLTVATVVSLGGEE